MKIRKIIALVFTAITVSLVLFNIPCKTANASNEQYEGLAGEWSAVWPGNRADRGTIIVHEIDEAKSKTRITYIIDAADEGHKEYEINADFLTEPSPTIKFNVRNNDFTCVFKKRKKQLDVSYVGGNLNNSCEMKKRPQIFSQIDELLEKNPLPPGQKSQAIMIEDNDIATISLVRSTEGAGLKPHFHRTHGEMLYAIKGQGQLLVNGKWMDFKPGSVHFNPEGKVHTTKQVGSEPLVFLSIFTPGMKDTDRQFVE